MALTTGQLLSGAGAVSQGMRQAEEAERVARQNQLRIEEQNRLAAAEARLREQRQAGLQVPGVAQFSPTGGQQFQRPGLQTQPQPQQPAAQAYPVNMREPQEQPIPAVTPATQRPPSAAIGPATYPGFETPMTQAERDRQVVLGTLDAAGNYIADRMYAPVELAQRSLGSTAALFNRGLRAAGVPESLAPTLPKESTLEGYFIEEEAPAAEPKAGVQESAPAKTKTSQAPAAGMDAQVFADAAIKNNLPTDTETLNEIVIFVNQGRTPEAAAEAVARSRSYDNTQTPYDTLITQAAQQYGINPTIFKRLIGTESSFDPNAVSPRGKKFGLGIGQIAAVHGLSDEQRLDPNVSIPKAAEIFAQYLNESGGDYNEAIMRYKGASSKEGRAAMQGPADIILAGTGAELVGKNPGQTADRVAQATSIAPAASGVMYGPSEANIAQTPGVQSALMARQILAERADMFYRLGMDGQALEAIGQINGIDLGLFKSQADVGIAELLTSGDAGRAMSVLSQFTGTPTQALARGDGTYDIYSNGRVTQTGVPVATLADLIRTSVDEGYRQRKSEQNAEMAKERAQTVREIGKEQVKGGYALAERAMELQQQQRLNLGNGQALIAEPDGSTYIIDAARIQQKESPQGVMMAPMVQKIPVE